MSTDTRGSSWSRGKGIASDRLFRLRERIDGRDGACSKGMCRFRCSHSKPCCHHATQTSISSTKHTNKKEQTSSKGKARTFMEIFTNYGQSTRTDLQEEGDGQGGANPAVSFRELGVCDVVGVIWASAHDVLKHARLSPRVVKDVNEGGRLLDDECHVAGIHRHKFVSVDTPVVYQVVSTHFK